MLATMLTKQPLVRIFMPAPSPEVRRQGWVRMLEPRVTGWRGGQPHMGPTRRGGNLADRGTWPPPDSNPGNRPGVPRRQDPSINVISFNALD
jgi:hypothetical protein